MTRTWQQQSHGKMVIGTAHDAGNRRPATRDARPWLPVMGAGAIRLKASSQGHRVPRSLAGFTLMELMIVLVIVALLASIAIPTYTQYVERARRADAKDALQTTAQRLERCFTQYGAYDDSNCAVVGDIGGSSTMDSPEGYYTIDAVSLTTTSFEVEAIPQGSQTNDECGNFELEDDGSKNVTGAGASTDECW